MFTSPCYAGTDSDAYRMGLECLNRGHFVQAIDLFSRVLNKNSRHKQALLFRSRAYAMADQFDLAIRDCDTLLSLDPKNGEAYFDRGLYRGFTSGPAGSIFSISGARADLQKAAKYLTDPEMRVEAEEILGGQQSAAATETIEKR
jgi:tetratricopeptide (TPR) repeat protein